MNHNSSSYFSTDQLKVIPCGQTGLRLQPLDFGLILDDANKEILKKLGNSEGIKKYLPNLDFSSDESIEKFVMGLSYKTEQGLEFAYSIKANNLILGMIFVNTPAINQKLIGLNHWTLDFFILEPFEGNHYMKIGLIYMMVFLKETIGVDEFLLMVDQDNEKCLNLIKSLPVDEIDNKGFKNKDKFGTPPFVYHCPLSNINFR